MVAFGFGEDDRDHLESAVCTLPLTLGSQIWIWIWICQLISPASDCKPTATTLTTITRVGSHTTPFSDVHPSLWTLLQVEGREPPPSSPSPSHRLSCPPPATPTTCPPPSFLSHEPKSCAHTAARTARTDPEVSLARGHRTTVAGGNRGQNHQVLILSLSRRRCLCPSRPISISGPAPLPQISGVLSACVRQRLCWRHCRWCLDPRRRTRAAKKLQLQLQLCLRLHLQLHSHLHLHLHLQLQPQLAAKHHRGRRRPHPHHEQAPSPPLIASGDLTPHRSIRRQVTGAGTGTDKGTGTVPAIHTYPPRPSAVKAVSAAPHPFQRLLTLPFEKIVDQLNSPP
ncbi:hypothetical protein F5883DRAFT_172293 [Diaporthe sp. PMI_573]|nr:hypothetical protein F5883DRAFT_172293 [Diaporthaceae sp. PMI_573]